MIARFSQRELGAVAAEAGAEIVASTSLKAALDLDWDDPVAKAQALATILQALEQVESLVEEHQDLDEATVTEAKDYLNIGKQVKAQDVEEAGDGSPKLRKSVAKDRRISIEDGQMRHGRKSRSKRFDGYKRHVLKDLDSGLVRAVGITPANAPEANVTEALAADLQKQKVMLEQLHIDRAYLNSTLVRERGPELKIICKAWPVRNGSRFHKSSFTLDWEDGLIYCPNQVAMPFTEGKVVRFPSAICSKCSLRSRCTTSKSGRSVSIHPDERLLVELRQRQTTAVGRGQLRERVSVEHTLAHIGQWQGDRARYLGSRKNLFDLRRMALVHNLHVIARMPKAKVEMAARSS